MLAEARAAVEAASHDGQGRRKKRKEKREAEARERAEQEALEKLEEDGVVEMDFYDNAELKRKRKTFFCRYFSERQKAVWK